MWFYCSYRQKERRPLENKPALPLSLQCLLRLTEEGKCCCGSCVVSTAGQWGATARAEGPRAGEGSLSGLRGTEKGLEPELLALSGPIPQQVSPT